MNINKYISMTLLAMYVFIAVFPYWNQLKICIDDCHIAIETIGDNCSESSDRHFGEHSHSDSDVEISDDCTDLDLPDAAEVHLVSSGEKKAIQANLFLKKIETPPFKISNSAKIDHNHSIFTKYPYLSPPDNQTFVFRL